jgi:hypothetical protein
MMDEDDDGNELTPLQDAIKAFAEGLESKDWPGAEQAFKDMWRLVDDDSGSSSGGEKKKDLAVMILGAKPKED